MTKATHAWMPDFVTGGFVTACRGRHRWERPTRISSAPQSGQRSSSCNAQSFRCWLVPPREGCRLPLNIGFLPLPVDPISKAMARPLRSRGITPLQRYYRAVRPSPAHQYFRPRGWSRLGLASPARFSRSVQVDHRHCRPAANENRGTARRLWYGLSK
jgi:hypothetical protein